MNKQGAFLYTFYYSNVFTQSSLGVLKPMALSTSRSEYEITGVHFVDDGASMIVCTMEDHKV